MVELMISPPPTIEEIDELVAFLPLLDSDEFTKYPTWSEFTQIGNCIRFPHPTYSDGIEHLFQIASRECWISYDYSGAREMLGNDETIQNATLDQIKTMLTYCVRGERFCDGHWDAMISKGYIRKILERLIEIKNQRL